MLASIRTLARPSLRSSTLQRVCLTKHSIPPTTSRSMASQTSSTEQGQRPTNAASSQNEPLPTKTQKLIFAPGENPSDTHAPQQAAQFQIGTLHATDLSSSPYTQFHAWFSDPRLTSTVPETVTLSTASLPSGRVSSRMVYLKELDERGWVIYSNFGTSRKAQDLESNAYAALCFWWKATERQVRVEGRAERLSREESFEYFRTRARGSRLGAWASRQSSVLEPRGEGDDGREVLEGQVGEVEKRFAGEEEIPVPEFWGGLRIVPEMVEFWQGRESRLHDRFRYTRVEGGEGWKVERLSP